jgi:hypothetical protein
MVVHDFVFAGVRLFCVDDHDDGLRTEFSGGFRYELGSGERRGSQCDLVCAARDSCADVIDGSDSPTESQGHETTSRYGIQDGQRVALSANFDIEAPVNPVIVADVEVDETRILRFERAARSGAEGRE